MPPLNLVLAGAAIGNGNRGVEALGRSVADAVDRDEPGHLLTILDDGWGVRPEATGRYERAHVEFAGVRRSLRWHRSESWARVRAAQVLGSRGNPVAQRLASAHAVLDLSAGDSFTDAYGPTRLATICAPKDAALRAGRPLVLLPQTYGPFTTAAGRQRAERLIRSAALAYARDERSLAILRELAGTAADGGRLRSGVDVAFALEPRRPNSEVASLIESLVAERAAPLAGVNVSGLLRFATARERFALAGDYVDTITGCVRGLLAAGARVVFVPHVDSPHGGGESDSAAIELVRARLTPAEIAQITVLPPGLDAAALKWCIARLDWFTGSRMHATIAALSTLTPAFGYAYSDKARGVFESCGMGAEVLDARVTSGGAAAEAMLASFAARDAVRGRLAVTMPPVIERARGQLAEVLDQVRAWQAQPHSAGAIA